MKSKKSQLWGFTGLFFLLVFLSVLLNLFHLSGLQELQQQEFSFFDYAQRRSHDASSKLSEGRIVIVGIQDEDLQNLPLTIPDDKTLAELLEKIRGQHPTAIGLDIIRDEPVGEGKGKLEEIFRTTPNLYGVGKFTGIPGDPYFQKIAPPPILFELGRVGDASIMVDDDGVVRRGNLFPTTGENAIPSLGLLLAHRYLTESGIREKTAPSGALQLGEVAFPIFEANDGGYVRADAGGYQILMNWYNSPQSWEQVSLGEVLGGNIPSNLFTGKIVLIGYYTTTYKQDIVRNPLSSAEGGKTPRKIFGVEIHANLVDYLLGTVMDGRPVLKAIPEWAESLIISFWIVATGTSVWLLRKIKSPLVLSVMGLSLAGFLSWLFLEINYEIFVRGLWLPAFPVVAIWMAAILSLFYVFREKILAHVEGLDAQIEEKTEELSLKNQKLDQTVSELNSAIATVKLQQEQLIKQEKLAFLGRLTAGFCHQFKNPFYLIKYSFQSVLDTFERLDLDEEDEEVEILKELVRDGQNSIDKLELLFKLILISPSRNNIAWLDAKPNEFVKSVAASAVKFRVLDISSSIQERIEFNFAPELNVKTKVPQQLEIPLYNLVENALDAVLEREKYEGERGFVPEIKITTRKLSREWEITVMDNGGGIAPSVRDKLFEPFVTSKSETEGIGLGLWISQEMMKKYLGGQIAWSVNDGQTIFILIVPFLEPSGA